MQLRLQRLDDGRVRVSTPQARGWAVCAKGPDQLWHAVQRAWLEAQRAGVAAWHGERTALDTLTDVDDPTEPAPRPMPDADVLAERAARRVSYAKDALHRPDVSNPADWYPNPPDVKGRSWTSPKRRRWYSSQFLGPVLAARARMGLSTSYEAWQATQGEVSA